MKYLRAARGALATLLPFVLAATALTGAALAGTSTGIAQDSPEDPGEARVRARALVDEAVAAFEANDYQTALERFRAAHALVPVEQLHFNMALCLERLARLREAAGEYEAAAASVSLTAEERARAREQLTLLRERLARIRLVGTEGALARVDGDQICAIPCALHVDPGPHTVLVDGAEAQSVELAQGQSAELRFEVAPTVADPSESAAPSGWTPGALFVIGALVAAAGGGGILGFGLTAQGLAEELRIMPDPRTASEGALMRDLANASIAVASAGALLVVLDLILGLSEPNAPPSRDTALLRF